MFFLDRAQAIKQVLSEGGIIRLVGTSFPLILSQWKTWNFLNRGQHNSRGRSLGLIFSAVFGLTADFFVEGEHYTFYRLLGGACGL